MTKPNGNPISPLINSLVSCWSKGQGSLTALATPSSSSSETQVGTPCIRFTWKDRFSPILITLVLGGSHPTPEDDGNQTLIVRVESDGLSIQTLRGVHLFIKTDDPAQQLQLSEIAEGIRHTANLARLSPQSSLSLIIAAQRLIAMSLDLQSKSPTKRGTSKVPAKHQFVTDLHDWLAENLVNSVKLGDAATKFKKSPRQIIRILKEATGSGFAEHLTMHRLTLARNHLMHTDASIMDIARRSGFNSREQFIRSFNKAFGWTPLQFRKAWNKASLSREDLIDLCQISERKPVVWLEPEQAANFASFSQKGAPHTLIVANALHEIVELFSIDPSGKRTRIGVLDRGAMMFINRDLEGSNWLVRAPDSNLERIFSTPSDHAAAIISPQLAQPNKKEGRRSESAALSH